MYVRTYVHTGAGHSDNKGFMSRDDFLVHTYVRTYLVIEFSLTVGQHGEGPPDLRDTRVEEG